MRIGIDISQLAYAETGVANYLKHLLEEMISQKQENTYVLFYSSRSKRFADLNLSFVNGDNVVVKEFFFPPTVLDLLWNSLHIVPIETFIGDVDIFITSDWTEPPSKHAKKATILYDLIVYKHPEETAMKIVRTQKRKLRWVQRESSAIFCISDATKQDAKRILHIDEKKLFVTYPGMTL
jgi:hypothetical protein